MQRCLRAKDKTYDLGVQLFTLMSVIDKDTKGTLQKVADLGYKNIESTFSRQGGFYGQTAEGFADMYTSGIYTKDGRIPQQVLPFFDLYLEFK